MKNYIVGSFTHESWLSHGKFWLASMREHKGDASILVFSTEPNEDVKTISYDGSFYDLMKKLRNRDGVFLYAAPHVRFQSSPSFVEAQSKFVVIPGSNGFHEDFWSAPSDLIDVLSKLIELTRETGCVPANFEFRHIGYFADFFPWFRHIGNNDYRMIYEAEERDGVYYFSDRILIAFGLIKPEIKKSVFSSAIKPKKSSLTTEL